ncbi:MAG: potassium channel family protein [Actinobacteria bacterium]|nr:potassium channel family protein [Actinomycetota bacterium]
MSATGTGLTKTEPVDGLDTAHDEEFGRALARYERWTEYPLVFLAILFFVVFAAPIIWVDLPARVVAACNWTNITIWIIFVVDYVIRLSLARFSWGFIKKNFFDLLIIALPMLRPLRALRALSIVGLISKKTKGDQRLQTTFFVITTAVLIGVIAALSITQAERGAPGSSIENVGDGLWWAITTMSTVGYGDMYPVTVQGRLIAGALMVTGIAVLGIVTASLAGWFMESMDEGRAEERTSTAGFEQMATHLQELRDEISELRRSVAEDRAGTRDGHNGTD